MNNFAFGSLVDQQLKCRFGNMLEGSLIVSSKPFRALNSKITSRDLNDTASIMNVTAMAPIQGRVSWTGNLLTFHFHQIDRTMVRWLLLFACKLFQVVTHVFSKLLCLH